MTPGRWFGKKETAESPAQTGLTAPVWYHVTA